MLKKRTIAEAEAEAEAMKAKRAVVPIHIPVECFKRIPICDWRVDECTGLASKVYVIVLFISSSFRSSICILLLPATALLASPREVSLAKSSFLFPILL